MKYFVPLSGLMKLLVVTEQKWDTSNMLCVFFLVSAINFFFTLETKTRQTVACSRNRCAEQYLNAVACDRKQ